MPVEGRCTLAAALHGHASFEGAQDHLWRLLCWLRMGPEGCDRRWVKNHFMSHRAAKNGNMQWHNRLRHDLSLASSDAQVPGRRRTSREAAWVQIAEKQHQQFAALPASLALQTGNVVIVQESGLWVPVVVLSLWRPYKRQHGAMLAVGEIPRGSLRSIRGRLQCFSVMSGSQFHSKHKLARLDFAVRQQQRHRVPG